MLRNLSVSTLPSHECETIVITSSPSGNLKKKEFNPSHPPPPPPTHQFQRLIYELMPFDGVSYAAVELGTMNPSDQKVELKLISPYL